MVSFGGRLSKFIINWEQLTTDLTILKTIEGVTFELNEMPKQCAVHSEFKFDANTTEKMNIEVESFLERGIIEKTVHEPDEIISNIFSREKKNGKLRIIGNFQELKH